MHLAKGYLYSTLLPILSTGQTVTKSEEQSTLGEAADIFRDITGDDIDAFAVLPNGTGVRVKR